MRKESRTHPLQKFVGVSAFAVGVVQFVPIVGAFGADFDRLYGVDVDGADLEILMRNRAVYLGATGGLLIWSAFATRLRPVAIGLSLIGLGSYVAIALQVGGFGDRLERLVIIDLAALALLAVAGGIELSERRGLLRLSKRLEGIQR